MFSRRRGHSYESGACSIVGGGLDLPVTGDGGARRKARCSQPYRPRAHPTAAGAGDERRQEQDSNPDCRGGEKLTKPRKRSPSVASKVHSIDNRVK